MAEIKKGSTSVFRYVMIVDSVSGAPETGVTITSLDLQYTQYGKAAAAKVDATAGSTTAYSANTVVEVNSTSSPGLHKVDWPDAAFATVAGVEGVLLVVTGAGFAPAVEDITLVDNVVGDVLDANDRVDVGTWLGTAVTTSATTAKPEVDVFSISDDSTAANNLELQYDTTGLSGDTFPASQAHSMRVFKGTATASSTAGKVFVQSADPPSGGADDDYNDALIIVWRGTDKTTARMNVRAISDYDDSDPSFTLDADLGFTPLNNDLVEVYAADTATLSGLSKLTTGFGTSVPDTLEGYLRAMMSKTASTPANAGTYSAATDSLEFIGERVALVEGTGFATGTDSLKEIRDAIDTLIAPAVVGASALSGSGFLSDCVTLVRRMTDEPSLLPKYTDADMVEHITSAMTVVMSELHNNSDHNIVCRFDITLVPGKQTYIMPPNMGELWAVRKMSTVTPIIPIYEVWADNHWSSHQSGFVLEYNEFRLLTDWRSTDVLEILYVPNGESFMHKATATSVAASSIVFPSSVTDGTLDTRANSYAGYLVRILTDTTGFVQERIIDTYDNVTRTATVTTAWDPLPTGTVVYEVLPTFSNIIKHCVCQQAAMDVLGNEGNNKRLQTLVGRYLVKIRALRQMIGKKSSRFGGHALGDTSDNDTRGDYYGWLV